MRYPDACAAADEVADLLEDTGMALHTFETARVVVAVKQAIIDHRMSGDCPHYAMVTKRERFARPCERCGALGRLSTHASRRASSKGGRYMRLTEAEFAMIYAAWVRTEPKGEPEP